MKIITKLLIVSLLIFPSLILSQQHIVSVKGNSIIMQLNFEDQKYNDEKNGNFIIRDYYQFSDPSHPGTYKLPYKEIIIAIPPNESPALNIISKSEKTNDHTIPKLNPVAELDKDSVIIYKEVAYKDRKTIENVKPVVEIKNYFWWRDFYCADVLIRTHSFDASTNSINEIKSITIEIKLSNNVSIQNNSPLKISSNFDKILKNAFFDSEIAEQFRTLSPKIYADTTGSWINYENTYVKVGTASDGLVRIYKSDLENLGVSTSSINPQTFKLYESGKELRIFVSGESDGIFDNTDYIEFWGSKNYSKISHHLINDDNHDYNEYLNRYTDTTFYFLTWGGSNGRRALLSNNFMAGLTDTLRYYNQKLHFEKNTMLQACNDSEAANNTPDWKKNKTWDWDWVFGTSTYSFSAADIFPNKVCYVYVKLISGGSNVAVNSHNIKLSVNNVKVDSQVVNRYNQVLLQGSINSNLLKDNNTITVQNFDNGTSPNYFARDWYEAEYPRSIKLSNDSLYFQISDDINKAPRVIKITNVVGDDFLIYKIKPDFKRITNFNIINK